MKKRERDNEMNDSNNKNGTKWNEKQENSEIYRRESIFRTYKIHGIETFKNLLRESCSYAIIHRINAIVLLKSFVSRYIVV